DGYETPLRVASKRHDIIAITVTDPLEEELPNVGLVNVADPETGEEVLIDTGDEELRQAYKKDAKRRVATRDEIFRRNRVDAIHVRTDRPYVDAIYKFFRMRERRIA